MKRKALMQMTDLIKWTERLIKNIEWQLVPEDMGIEDCVPFILDAIEYFYIMSGKAMQWSDELVIKDEADVPVTFNADFKMDERAYILVTAEIGFYQKVQSDVNELMSYSTDAMTVANADKPFANLDSMIEKLRGKQLEIWHKMTRYNML